MEFNWEAFKKSRNIVMNCKTQQEAIDFCKQMHEHGMEWRNGSSYAEVTYWELCEEGTICYSSDGTAVDLNHCKDYNYTILEWSYYME